MANPTVLRLAVQILLSLKKKRLGVCFDGWNKVIILNESSIQC